MAEDPWGADYQRGGALYTGPKDAPAASTPLSAPATATTTNAAPAVPAPEPQAQPSATELLKAKYPVSEHSLASPNVSIASPPRPTVGEMASQWGMTDRPEDRIRSGFADGGSVNTLPPHAFHGRRGFKGES